MAILVVLSSVRCLRLQKRLKLGTNVRHVSTLCVAYVAFETQQIDQFPG